jgi:hypothetical protein
LKHFIVKNACGYYAFHTSLPPPPDHQVPEIAIAALRTRIAADAAPLSLMKELCLKIETGGHVPPRLNRPEQKVRGPVEGTK